MFKISSLLVFSMVVISFNSSAATIQEGNERALSSINKCMTLLPDNYHEYDFNISGVVNKQKEFTGEFNFTDKTNQKLNKKITEDEYDKLIPFQDCVMELIK